MTYPNVADRRRLTVMASGVDKERLVEARRLLGVSQDTAANLIGVTTGAVKSWESGRRWQITPESLIKIADAYGCTVDWLLGRTDVGPVKRASPPAEADDPLAPAAADSVQRRSSRRTRGAA